MSGSEQTWFANLEVRLSGQDRLKPRLLSQTISLIRLNRQSSYLFRCQNLFLRSAWECHLGRSASCATQSVEGSIPCGAWNENVNGYQSSIVMSETFVLAPTNVRESGDEFQPLINACLAGDEAMYGVLYGKLSGMIYRLTYGLLQNKEDAEEVLQDSFEYAFRNLHRFDSHKSAFKTWLYQIALSRCRNKRRRKWLPSFSLNQLLGQDVTDTETPLPDETLALSGEQKAVWEALKQLSPKLRETALLRYYEGLTYGEIGDIVGVPAKTAESRMRLAHQELKKLLLETGY